MATVQRGVTIGQVRKRPKADRWYREWSREQDALIRGVGRDVPEPWKRGRRYGDSEVLEIWRDPPRLRHDPTWAKKSTTWLVPEYLRGGG